MIEVLVKRKYNKWDLQNQKAAKNANALKCAIKGGVNIVIDEKLLYNKTEDNFGIDNQ